MNQTEHQYKRIFMAVPGKILILTPENCEIVAVTDAYLKTTMTRESDLVGRTLSEVFSDHAWGQHTDGVHSVDRSLQRVLSLKMFDIMDIQRCSMRLPDGALEERFWSLSNRPVLDDADNIEFIVHSLEDVTPIVQESAASYAREGGAVSDYSTAVRELTLRTRELTNASARLQACEARLRTAERLLNLGSWDFNVRTGQLSWSERVYNEYDLPAGHPAPDFEGYFALVHPDDREASRAVYADFMEQKAPQIEFQHRITARDGRLRHIRGVGERHLSPDGEIVVGFTQDVTTLVRSQQKLSFSEQLVRLAGEKAQLGGWRVDLGSESVIWTPETAAIHRLPADYSPPSLSAAIEFYAPEYREAIQSAFERCARDGEPFDLICRLQVAEGKRPWVRAIGVPERDENGGINAVQGAFQDVTTLHEAQARAFDAQRERRDVLESISDAFFAVDKKWVITYMNQQAGVALERSRDTLLGKSLWDEFPEALGSEFQRQYAVALETQQTRQFVGFYSPLSKWFDVSAYPIPDGLAVYFRDVTIERERQQQLRLADAALARQNDIVIITEAEGLNAPDGPRIVYVNQAFERLTGFTRSEAIGSTPRLLQGAETDRQQLDRIREALHSRSAVRSELKNYSKTGESYWLELEITPLFDDDGRCTHFVSVERDITERKSREAELQASRERVALIAQATNDVIWDWDLISEQVWWSGSITNVFGYAISELEPGPESWLRRIHPADRVRVRDSIHGIIEGDDEKWSAEYRFIRSDGEIAAVFDRGTVIRDQSGKAIRIVGSMLDITERKEIELHLRESQKLEAVGHLTGGVAHDFNNLLTVIQGNSETLVDLVDPKLGPMAKMILSAAERGAKLTRRLLAFARRQPLDPKPTDINQIVKGILGLIRRTLPASIDLVFLPDPDLAISELDAGELDTALLNLIVNARDAMHEGGKLTIETANVTLDRYYASHYPEVATGEYVMVCVSDTGTGMDSETVRRAFEPFFTTKAVGKGTGLGLSMVFGFTKQSGGHIRIYSEPDEGTSVKLYFPRAQTQQGSTFQPKIVAPLQGGTEHILIAEDDDLVLNNLEAQLLLLGYRVTKAISGPDALNALRAHNDIDLLLTDIIMPGGMNGRELADRARAAYPSLKVLFTSGYSENAIVHHGRLDAGVELLSKPYSRQELANKVRLAMRRPATE